MAILTIDTRYVILAAALVVIAFAIVLKLSKNRFPTRDEATALGLTLLQLYSAPVLLAMLVLTQPPAIGAVGTFQRQSAGLLSFIFLFVGVLGQISTLWKGPKVQ